MPDKMTLDELLKIIAAKADVNYKKHEEANAIGNTPLGHLCKGMYVGYSDSYDIIQAHRAALEAGIYEQEERKRAMCNCEKCTDTDTDGLHDHPMQPGSW